MALNGTSCPGCRQEGFEDSFLYIMGSMGARNPRLDAKQRIFKDTLRVLPVSKTSATVPQQDDYLISRVSWAQRYCSSWQPVRYKSRGYCSAT